MMKGAKSTEIASEEPVFIQSTDDSINGVLQDLQRRRDNVLGGGINCIPLPFKRFRQDIPGIEQEQYVIVTASTKVGKSMLASYIYIYEALDYAFENPEQCSVDVLYFPLEESISRVIQRYMSHLLYKLDGYRISPQDLRSTSRDYPIPEEALELLQSERYQERLRYFEQHVIFNKEDTNPTGILRACERFAKTVGDYKTKTVRRSDGFTEKEIEVFDSYTPHDMNHYTIVFIDHLSLVDTEAGMSLKQSMEKVSEYCIKYLRDRYKFTCVVIQQQAFETEGLEAIKQKKMTPTAAGLSDSKYTSRDANLVLGLFDPSQFDLPAYLGYKINSIEGQGLRNYGRFMSVIRGRDGQAGGICPLFFDGAVCNFEELPRPDDINGITQYYNKAATLKSYRQQKKYTQLILANLNHNG